MSAVSDSLANKVPGTVPTYTPVEGLASDAPLEEDAVVPTPDTTSVVELQHVRHSPESPELATLEDATPQLEKILRASLGADGFLSDVIECRISDVVAPDAVVPWKGFSSCCLYKSASATTALRSLLQCKAPGTSKSFQAILSAVAFGSSKTGKQQHYCYLVGGQVRDVLRGKLSNDIDFNYSCTAQEVALVTVAHGWPTKFKAIGDGITEPNYVLIGDEGSSSYLEVLLVVRAIHVHVPRSDCDRMIDAVYARRASASTSMPQSPAT
eukprot:1215696-Prymnesium_polylepis.1